MITITKEIELEAIKLLKEDKEQDFFELFFNFDGEIVVGNDVEFNAVELETWTDGGVDMIISLYDDREDRSDYVQGLLLKTFIDYVKDFDVDETIDLHREDSKYKKDFTIKESLKDFGDYLKWLKNIVRIIKKSKVLKYDYREY